MKYWMYLSCWKEHGGAPGLALFSVDTESGQLSFHKMLNDKISFGCSAVDINRQVLYLCNETEKVFGEFFETGRIYGYKINPEDGTLIELFHRDTYCPNPSYISLDPSGAFAVVTHISISSSIATLEKEKDGKINPIIRPRKAYLQLYQVCEDGTLGKLLDVATHEVDPGSKFHASMLHCAVFSPSGQLFAVCDKGNGRVYLYRIDKKGGFLKLLNQALTDVPGSQPRYCVFHPTKPFFAVNHEKARGNQLLVSSFRYSESGEIERICTENILPEGYAVSSKSHIEQQGLCISANGQYVYTCLKEGPNGIGVLEFQDDGSLKRIGIMPIEGKWPRGLVRVPSSNFILSSCLDSGDVSSYALGNDGSLRIVDQATQIQGGTYMSFLPQIR